MAKRSPRGVLLYGTVHSLAIALRNYNVKVYFISPDQLRMWEDAIRDIDGKLDFLEISDLKAILPELNILYTTTVQKERFPDPTEYEDVRNHLLLTGPS